MCLLLKIIDHALFLSKHVFQHSIPNQKRHVGTQPIDGRCNSTLRSEEARVGPSLKPCNLAPQTRLGSSHFSTKSCLFFAK